LELKGEQCPNEAEFRAYIILLNMNDGNFMWEVSSFLIFVIRFDSVVFFNLFVKSLFVNFTFNNKQILL